MLAIVLGLASAPSTARTPLSHIGREGSRHLADQQLAAGVMWVPGSVPYCVVLVIASLRWLDPATSAGAEARR